MRRGTASQVGKRVIDNSGFDVVVVVFWCVCFRFLAVGKEKWGKKVEKGKKVINSFLAESVRLKITCAIHDQVDMTVFGAFLFGSNGGIDGGGGLVIGFYRPVNRIGLPKREGRRERGGRESAQIFQ